MTAPATNAVTSSATIHCGSTLSERGSAKGSAAAASVARTTGQRGSYLISVILYDSVSGRAAGASFYSRSRGPCAELTFRTRHERERRQRTYRGTSKVEARNARRPPPRHQCREGQARLHGRPVRALQGSRLRRREDAPQ